jgi:hypothetical protein
MGVNHYHESTSALAGVIFTGQVYANSLSFGRQATRFARLLTDETELAAVTRDRIVADDRRWLRGAV